MNGLTYKHQSRNSVTSLRAIFELYMMFVMYVFVH